MVASGGLDADLQLDAEFFGNPVFRERCRGYFQELQSLSLFVGSGASQFGPPMDQG